LRSLSGSALGAIGPWGGAIAKEKKKPKIGEEKAKRLPEDRRRRMKQRRKGRWEEGAQSIAKERLNGPSKDASGAGSDCSVRRFSRCASAFARVRAWAIRQTQPRDHVLKHKEVSRNSSSRRFPLVFIPAIE